MRIGLITGEYPPLQGGIGAYTDILSRRFVAQGHEVFIFSNRMAKQQSPKIHLTNQISKWGYRTNRLIQKWADDKQIEILNLQFQTAAFDMSAWVHFLPQMVKVPFVTTFHDLRFPYLFPKAGSLRNWIVMHLAKQSNGVIVTNHEDLQRVEHLNATLIPIGSNILVLANVETAAWRQKIGLKANDFIIGHFGFINHSKGIDTLLHALAMLDNPNLKLLMIGGRTGTADPTNAAYVDSIEVLISDLGLEERVIWTGYVDEADVSAYLQTVDIMTLPFRDGASFRRGSLMASIQHQCAIITTQPTIPIPEFSNTKMKLVPPNDAEALAKAIQALVDSPDVRQQLRSAVYQLHHHFDWEVIAKDTITYFEKVMGHFT